MLLGFGAVGDKALGDCYTQLGTVTANNGAIAESLLAVHRDLGEGGAIESLGTTAQHARVSLENTKLVRRDVNVASEDGSVTRTDFALHDEEISKTVTNLAIIIEKILTVRQDNRTPIEATALISASTTDSTFSLEFTRNVSYDSIGTLTENTTAVQRMLGESGPFEFTASVHANTGVDIELKVSVSAQAPSHTEYLSATQRDVTGLLEFLSHARNDDAVVTESLGSIRSSDTPAQSEFIGTTQRDAPVLAENIARAIIDRVIPQESKVTLRYDSAFHDEVISAVSKHDRDQVEITLKVRTDDAVLSENISAAGRSNGGVLIESLGTILSSSVAPIEGISTARRNTSIVFENLGGTRRDWGVPLEKTQLTRTDHNMPTESESTTFVIASHAVVLEAIHGNATATGVHTESLYTTVVRAALAPTEWQTFVRSDKSIPEEVISALRSDSAVVFEFYRIPSSTFVKVVITLQRGGVRVTLSGIEQIIDNVEDLGPINDGPTWN